MINSKSRLKPCPFCGDDDPKINFAVGEYWVSCDVCDSSSSLRSSEETAITYWNMRSPEAFQFKADGKTLDV